MDFVVECKKQFDEMMASKGQPDHEYHLENYQCLALNITPEMLDEIIRLRAEVEKLRRRFASRGLGHQTRHSASLGTRSRSR